ncbi:hypothetical protein M2140_000145 [Clostridiales Family XIII bacterium PM5-7]
MSRIYAILPMKETAVETIDEYVSSLNRELIRNIDVFGNCEHILSVVCLLEHVVSEDNHDIYRKEVLNCCNIVSRAGVVNV